VVVWDRIELSQHVKVACKPPGKREIETLRKEGVRAVIDLRTQDEAIGQDMPPVAEAKQVRAHGMDYIHIPVSAVSVDKTDLDRVGEALRQAPKPVLIHGSSGSRAGMIALAHVAIEGGVPGTEMMEMARHLDLVFGDPSQQEVFTHYVDQRRTRPDPFARRKEALRADGRPLPLLGEDTRTLAGEIQEDHHREFAQDHAHVVAPAPMEARPTAITPSAPASTDIPATEPPRPAARRAPAPKPALTPGPNLPPTSHAAPETARPPPAARLASRIKVVPLAAPRHAAPAFAWSPPTPAALGMGAAIATAILLAIDRKLLIPLLIAAGVIGARAIARLPPSALRETLLADPVPDDDINDLEKRVQRLAKRA
jgi:uncharacterized protein (TIGR01244 family)